MAHFTITVWSHPDFEELVADVNYGDDLVALVSQEAGWDSLDVALFPVGRPEGPVQFKLADFEHALQAARKRLWDLRRGSPEDT